MILDFYMKCPRARATRASVHGSPPLIFAGKRRQGVASLHYPALARCAFTHAAWCSRMIGRIEGPSLTQIGIVMSFGLASGKSGRSMYFLHHSTSSAYILPAK